MQYELECGHCGYQFVLEAALPRTTKCSVCGGVLAIVVPVPLAPPAPAPPLPAAPAPALDNPAPEIRARLLAPPWPAVRFSLGCARHVTDFAATLLAVLTAVTLIVGPRVQPAAWWVIGHLPSGSTCALLLLAVLHTVYQWRCASAPRMCGRGFTNASLLTLPSTVGGFALGWFPGWAGLFFQVFGAAAFAISFGYWLAFLGRLGRRLGDAALVEAAQSYRVWFPFGLVLLAVLLTGAAVAERAPSPPLVWFGRAGAGVLGFVLLRQYAALLRIAVSAIDRRAPAY
jgi:hypothetical protein